MWQAISQKGISEDGCCPRKIRRQLFSVLCLRCIENNAESVDIGFGSSEQSENARSGRSAVSVANRPARTSPLLLAAIAGQQLHRVDKGAVFAADFGDCFTGLKLESAETTAISSMFLAFYLSSLFVCINKLYGIDVLLAVPYTNFHNVEPFGLVVGIVTTTSSS